jgi:hypothetical protein
MMSGFGLMGLLFLDFWIVDASIARTVAPGFSFGWLGVVFVWVFVFVVCVFAVLMMVHRRGVFSWWCVVVFVECLFGKL